MNKQLSRSDYLFALLFLLMLVGIVAAFFFGMQMGKSKAEARYEELLSKDKQQAKEQAAYSQQYLVSFYHTIYVPYIDFEKKWFERRSDIELQSSSDPSALLKELSALADEKYKAIVSMSMPNSSPLLQQSHQNYLKSLKLFHDGLDNFRGKANSVSGPDLIAQIETSDMFTAARSYALTAQQNFYDAMGMWYASANPDFHPVDFTSAPQLSTDSWSRLNLIAKNAYIAGLMAADNIFAPYAPQDLVARIDEMIDSGQAQKLNLSDIRQISHLLNDTDAVRPGDFQKSAVKRYSREPMPQLPFFVS